MRPDPAALAPYMWPAAWTAITLAAAWLIGRGTVALLSARTSRWRGHAAYPWLEAVRQAVRPRLPWWVVLVGLWVSTGYWPLTPEWRAFLTQALFVAGAASLTLAAAAVASHSVDQYAETLAPVMPVTSLTRNIAWAMVVVTGGLVVLNGLGISITPMLTALGVGGLAVALALQEPLSNFFAGFFMSIAGQVRVGDYISLDTGQEGYVTDFSWRSTRLKMLANNLVVVPNAKLAQALVVNYSLPSRDLAVLVEMGVDYASDLAVVERVVMEVGAEVMRDVPGGVPSFEPFIRYHTFADSSVNFTVILRGEDVVARFLVKHEFVKRVHARFRAEGIVIPFPIRTVHHVRAEAEAPALTGR
ncbi:MAG: mechanosensitive ion channel family protein [Vicinamibacterales bacterium]